MTDVERNLRAVRERIDAAARAAGREPGSVALLAISKTWPAADVRAMAALGQHDFGENTILPAFMAIRDLQRSQAGVLDYLSDMGIDLRLMSLALRTPPEDITILTPGQMQDFRLVTG